jgi:hypothetical protein
MVILAPAQVVFLSVDKICLTDVFRSLVFTVTFSLRILFLVFLFFNCNR